MIRIIRSSVRRVRTFPNPRFAGSVGLMPLLLASIGLILSAADSPDERTEQASNTTALRSGDSIPLDDSFPLGELWLVNDDFAKGRLVHSDQADRLRWHASGFTSPFEFDIPAVRSVRFPLPEDALSPSAPRGVYSFELHDGDFLHGKLRELTNDELVVEVSGTTSEPTLYRIERNRVRRLVRWQEGNALIYDGPRGLDGWTLTPPEIWSDDAGQLATRESGGKAFGDFEIPDRARLELEISWKSQPNFAIALGADASELSQRHAFRIEAWHDELVLLCERDEDADVVFLEKLGPVQGTARLQIYLDQLRRRILVYSAMGSLLGELDFQSESTTPYRGIHIANSGNEFRLERLRITRWNGQPPRTNTDGLERVYLADGSVRFGTIRRFRTDNRQFVLDVDGQEITIPQDQFESAALSIADPTTATDAVNPAKRIRVICRDGVRLAGQLNRVTDGQLWLDVPGFREPWRTPLRNIQSLIVLHFDVPSTPVGGRIGRLEIPGVRLQGQLVNGEARGNATCLVWHPRGSRTSSPLRAGTNGRIVYRDTRPENPASRATAVQRGVVPAPRVGVVGGFFRALTGNQPTTSRPTRTVLARALHLRTGDTIPGEVKRIDEAGVTFETPVTDVQFVPHEKIKSLDLDQSFGAPRSDPVKRERLLTLPRMQRNNPPTHLIVSRNGDYLRARLLEMDEKQATVEVRLETQVIPRERIAQIIWLHLDELTELESATPVRSDLADEDAARNDSPQDGSRSNGSLSPITSISSGTDVDDETADSNAFLRIQALKNDGIRLTFWAKRVAEDSVIGSSDVLGDCQVDIDEVDQILLGRMIEQSAAQLATNRWRLQNSPDPRYIQDAEASSNQRVPGSDSPLVGQPAPDFTLPLLSGEAFDLSQHRGKVVVLDFWATWCGPCLQTMPQIERAVSQFSDRQVALVAVNLQETPDVIRSTLERWQLEPTVAMDRDGVVSQRYRVTAIPQTVIIDRDGQVAKLFIGGGARFEEQLLDALREVVEE